MSFCAEDGLIFSNGLMEGIMFFYLLDGTLHEIVVVFGVGWLLFDEGGFEHEELGSD